MASPPLLPSGVPVLTATKTDNRPSIDPATANPGDTIMYTVVISNTGTADATNVNFNDTVDANTTLVVGSFKASPIALNDSYNTIGNVPISISAPGVRANDLNPNVIPSTDITALTVTQVNATAVPGGGMATASTTHGSVTMHSDGSFDYSPTAGFAGPTDTFMYTLGNGTGKTDTATVTITVSGLIWFVDNTVGPPGDGRLGTPFRTLVGGANPLTGTVANDVIFIYTGSGNYTGGLTLTSGEKVIGQGATQTILAITGFSAPSPTNPLPSTGGTNPVITTTGADAITLGSNNGLHGFTIGDTTAAGDDISGSAFGNLTVKSVTLNGTGEALNLANGTIVSGSTFPTVESNGGGVQGIHLSQVGGGFTITTTNIVNPTGNGIDVQNSPAGTAFNFGATTVNKGSTAGTGVNLAFNSGTFSFSSLTVTTSNGTGVDVSSSGTVNVSGGSIDATSGPALLVDPTAIAMTFSTVSSTNSGTTGISLTSVSGSLTIGTTTITNPTGIGISETSSSATVNFGSTTVNGSANTGVLLGGSGVGNTGTITFSALNIAPDASKRGLLAQENTNTITTTSGAITTSTAVAVEITRSSSTTPLAVSLTSVSANGGASGIILTNTNGSFTIAGDAGSTNNSSGGTIQNSTSHGISLSNATNISLDQMNIQNTGGSGINGTLVTTFTFTNGTINNSGNAVGESNIAFNGSGSLAGNNLAGTLTVTNSTLTNAFDCGIHVEGNDGTVSNAVVTGNTITSTTSTATSKGDGIRLVGTGTASTVNSLTKATISGNTVMNFPSAAGIQVNYGNTVAGGPLATAGIPGDATNIISIVNNPTISGNSAANRFGTSAIELGMNSVSSGQRGRMNYDVSGNGSVGSPIGNCLGTAILIGNNGYSTMTGTVNNNVIAANNTVASNGIGGGNGIVSSTAETPDLTLTVNGNTISQVDGNGILLVSRGVTGLAKLAIKNNTVAAPLTGLRPGIRVDAGNAASVDDAVCVDISGNTTAGSGSVAGIGLRKNGTVTTTNDFGVVGMAATSSPGVEQFVGNGAGKNPGSANGVGDGSVNGVLLISAASGFSNCNTAPMSVPGGGDVTISSAKPTTDGAATNSSSEGQAPLQAARGKAPKDDSVKKLTQEELNWMVQAAIARWVETGISVEDIARLQAATFEIADLPEGQIASLASTHITIDETGAGYGWFFDQSPQEDSEFDVPVPGKELQTTELSPAHGKMDLLTVVMRELGAVSLQGKKRTPKAIRPLMEGTLSPAVRRLPDFSLARITPPEPDPSSAPQAPPAESGSSSQNSGSSSTGSQASTVQTASKVVAQSTGMISQALGTIPPGKSVTLMFSVTVSDPFTGASPQVSNQGSVSSNELPTFMTDDPDTMAAGDATVTPINLPDVSVAVSPSSTLEDSGTGMVYTFTRTGSAAGAITVNFSVGGTATPPGGATPDYTQTGAATFTTTTGTVSIPGGGATNTATVTITPIADTTVEPNETVVLTVTSGTGYDIAANPNNTATGTITNDDTDVSVAVSPTSVAENSGTAMMYTFTRAGVTTGTLTVNFSATGTAMATNDYTVSGTGVTFDTGTGLGTVQITGSNTTAIVNVTPTADNTVEPDETVILTVTSGTGYNVGTPSMATGTITNDDATVSVAVSTTSGPGTSVLEDGSVNLVYTFTRTGFTGGPLTVNFDVSGSTASATGPGTDYTISGAGVTFTPATGLGTVTFSGTNTTTTLTVDPTADSTGEPNETVVVNVAAGTNYTATAPTSATGTIIDDDTSVGVTVSPSSVLEDSGTPLVYTFTRSGDTTTALTVNFTATGTASPTSDYTVSGTGVTFDTGTGLGTIAIGSGVTMVTANVNPTADMTVESNETVIITVTSGTGYVVSGSNPSATGTITNDDTDVSVTVSPSSVAENSGTGMIYTFTRTGVTTGTITVNFNVSGSADFSTDYTQSGAATFSSSSGMVQITGSNTTATVTITPVADNDVEPDETVILGVAAGTGYNVAASNNSATGTITNDDATVTVAVSPASVNEDGATNLVYTFTRTGFTGAPLTVGFSVGGTATPPGGVTPDYSQTGAATFTTSSGTVTFTGTNTTAAVTVDPTADSTPESNETVILTLTGGTNYTVGSPSAATGTILDDDTMVSVAVSPTSVLEDSGSSMTYTFTRAGDTSGALVVNFSVTGSATFTTDYGQSGATSFTPPTGTVTIGAGNTMAQIVVTPVADSTVESDETVVLTVTSGAGYSVGAPSMATGTITNDDTDVSVAVSPSSVAENSGSAMVYTFTRTGVTTGAITVNFDVGGTATFTTDYAQSGAATFTASSGTVTIASGNTTAQVSILPLPDNTVEPDETVILTVTAGTGYNVAALNNSATGTILNDDTDVTVAVSPASVAEDGATNLVYTFTRNGVTTGALTVNFSVGGTATPPGGVTPDYSEMGAATFTTSSGTVSFGAGNSTVMVTVDPTADTTLEPDETVTLTVTSGAGYNVASPSAATGTILNDDIDVSVAVSPMSVAEDGATNLDYTFTRNGPTTSSLTVNFSVSGTATFNTDYTQSGAATFTASSGTVTFGVGNSTATVTIDPTADTTVEPDETVILMVTSGTGYNPASPTSATGTITNDDTDVTVAVSPASVAEDGATNLVYTFTRTGVTTGALTANFSVGGTATFNTDYTEMGAATFTASSGTVTFGAGVTTAMVTVDPTADNTVEPDETVILTVTSGTGYNPGSPGAATGTITNDDTDVTVAVSPNSVAEDGATNMVYTFTRTGVTTGSLTVNFSVGGTATPPGGGTPDYTEMGAATFTTSSGTVTFGAGVTTAMVTVDPTADSTAEPDETVIFTVTSGAGYNIASPSSATGTILNDDAVDVAITSKTDNPDPVCVGQNITYTINFVNNGPGSAPNVTVTDAVPANTTFVSASVTTGTGWGRTDSVSAGGTGNIVFAKASVANGETAVFQIVVNVNAGVMHGTVISNTATAASSFPDPNPNNNSQSATTTVDPIPPTFNSTPPDVVVVATPSCPFATGTQVAFAAPAASDNCAVQSVICNPPAGSVFPTGTTTVTCTATDTAGNTAQTSFAVTVFSFCLQDDSTPGNVVFVNATTGDYVFCSGGVQIASGRGTLTVRGCQFGIEHAKGDRRVHIGGDTSANNGLGAGNAVITKANGHMVIQITDRNMTNNTCSCSPAPPQALPREPDPGKRINGN